MRTTLIILVLASLSMLGWGYRGLWEVDPLTVPAANDGWAYTASGLAGAKPENATFAAGCFWGTESIFRKVPGVVRTRVGYTGGIFVNPKYLDVASGRSAHVEAIDLEFDPAKVSYQDLLKIFFTSHDPTENGPSEYRSVVFYHSNEQKQMADEMKAHLDYSGEYVLPIATTIVPADVFYPAEEYHQRYYESRDSNHVCSVYNGKKPNSVNAPTTAKSIAAK